MHHTSGCIIWKRLVEDKDDSGQFRDDEKNGGSKNKIFTMITEEREENVKY